MVAVLQGLGEAPDTLDGPTLATPKGERPFVMIDGFNLGLEKGTGVATYARNLSYGLRDLGCEVGVLYGGPFAARDPALLKEVLFYDTESPVTPWQHLRRGLKKLLTPTWNRAFEVPATGSVISRGFESRLPYYDSLWNARDLFRKANAQFETFRAVNSVSMPRKPDLVHWTYPLPLRVKGVPNIYTLHDLVPLRLPYTTLDKKATYLRLVSWIAETADHIVTVSECSKRDIVELLRVPPDKVTNTYEAVTIPAEIRNRPDDAVRHEVEGAFGLSYKGYFLFFGSIEPKKNIGRLLQGYLTSGVTTPLVIVGARAWKAETELGLLDAERVRSQLKRERAGGEIVRLEYAPFGLLMSLIRGAKAVVFPSLYEGFGLPVLEAMTLGTPVLTTRTSSVPEIAGDAALLVDPYDPQAIASGMRVLDQDEGLRERLAADGQRQASLFGEAAYRRRLFDAYGAVLERACSRPAAATTNR